MTRFTVPLLLLVLLSASCQRINVERTVALDAIVIKRLEFSPPAYQQKVTVSISGTIGPVSAYLVKSGDEEKVETALDQNKPLPDSVFGSKVNKTSAEDYSFEATVPAKVGYSLLLRAEEKRTDVKVKVVGR